MLGRKPNFADEAALSCLTRHHLLWTLGQIARFTALRLLGMHPCKPYQL